jgi:alpha-galactosidase
MGWNGWYRFRCRVDERLVRATADAMVASGMRARGYRYVNLDDCWMAPQRDASGALVADPVRFPNGIRALADYVHRRGLRLGIYAGAGTTTCARFPGSAGHFAQDAAAFAAWGVDFVKLDWCGAGSPRTAPSVYRAMREAIRRARRPMVLSICQYGLSTPWVWGPRVGHLWRISHDVGWYGNPGRPWRILLRIADRNAGLLSYARPGAWNDPDILQVGNQGLTPTEQRSIFSLWSMLSAPLLAGNDVRTMSSSTRETLTNPEVIAINQDARRIRGIRRSTSGGRETWVRALSDGATAVLVLNRLARTTTVRADVRRLRIGQSKRYLVRNLWTHRTLTTPGPIRIILPPHGVAMFRIRPG